MKCTCDLVGEWYQREVLGKVPGAISRTLMGVYGASNSHHQSACRKSHMEKVVMVFVKTPTLMDIMDLETLTHRDLRPGESVQFVVHCASGLALGALQPLPKRCTVKTLRRTVAAWMDGCTMPPSVS